MSQLRCYTCLQLDRKLSPLKAQVKFLFALLCPEMFIKTTSWSHSESCSVRWSKAPLKICKDSAQYLICWECEFMADKIKRFQTKLKKANEILNLSFKGKTTSIEGLSCLKVTSVETISLILPQSTPILLQNVPMLPQNLPTLPMLPQNEQKLPLNEPMLPLNVPMLPKIVPKVPQNILELSLKDMLAIPLKMDQQAEVKIEVEDEETDSNDFDELIQPSTILSVPMEELDPLLIPRLKQPAEIEVPPQKPVKDEITDPAIDYIPQKVFINAPKDEVKLRGFREPVKVTADDPNLVMGTEVNPVLMNKDIVPIKGKKSDELLTKLLTTPSKREELFFKTQRVPNSPECHEKSGIDRQRDSNPPNESELSEQSAGVTCREDEAKLIILNKTEVNAQRDKKRSRPVYLAASHKCERCIEWFQSPDKLDEHNLKHDVLRGNSICDICEQRFADNSLRYEHYKQHFIVYECRKCPSRYTNRVQLMVHCQRKHEESTFLCKTCFAVFKTFRERSRHIFQNHSQSSDCEECGKTFSTARMLRVHVLNIHKAKPVGCPICKKMVKKNSLKAHMKTHDDTSDERIYCVDCGTTYKSKYIYDYHLKKSLKHNTIEKLGFKCDHCDKYFANKRSLKDHIEEIGGVKYTCDICKKDSKTKRILASHIQVVHEGKKPKKKLKICEVCGKSFTVKRSLREHLNIHLGVRPHVCKDCGATFTYSAALFTHRRLKHKVNRKFEMKS